MRKVYKCLIDGDKRDRVIIDNEQEYSSLFFIETVVYDEDTGEQVGDVIGISKEDALDLAHSIIRELS